MTRGSGNTAGEWRRRLFATLGLLALSAALGALVNAVRPAGTRLPWVQDWSRHIESLAFRHDIPVALLLSARGQIQDSATVVFDARSPEEYADGHILDAHSLPVADADREIVRYMHIVAPDTPILVYCGSATCEDALELALKLRDLGFTAVTLYPGGYAEWIEYDGATAQGDAP